MNRKIISMFNSSIFIDDSSKLYKIDECFFNAIIDNFSDKTTCGYHWKKKYIESIAEAMKSNDVKAVGIYIDSEGNIESIFVKTYDLDCYDCYNRIYSYPDINLKKISVELVEFLYKNKNIISTEMLYH